jgi:hypothetical protein
MHLTEMNGVLRSKNGFGNHFKVENRLRVGRLVRFGISIDQEVSRSHISHALQRV